MIGTDLAWASIGFVLGLGFAALLRFFTIGYLHGGGKK